jgi:hypothetical protein
MLPLLMVFDCLYARNKHLRKQPLLCAPQREDVLDGQTLKWLKVKQARFRESERGWEPKR